LTVQIQTAVFLVYILFQNLFPEWKPYTANIVCFKSFIRPVDNTPYSGAGTGGARGSLASPIFGRLVNPISTGEGRLSPSITTGTPQCFSPSGITALMNQPGLNMFFCYLETMLCIGSQYQVNEPGSAPVIYSNVHRHRLWEQI
jgi:hypothetical protein